MKRTKLFATYLPQFHEIKENNLFWGKGFTDWISVKKSMPVYEGHNQPRVPLKNNYYDLSDKKVIEWQATLARTYGIDGFCIYHYWFENGYKVLEKPAENLLNDKTIAIQYFFCWDNNSWIRSWSNINGNAWAPSFDNNDKSGREYLLKIGHGDEKQWKEHFDYLLPFFKDERYFRIDNKPVFAFFSTGEEECLRKMEIYWKELAIKSGLDGLYLLSPKDPFFNKKLFDAQFIYQPMASAWAKKNAIISRVYKLMKRKPKNNKPFIFDYDKVWKKIISITKKNIDKNIIPGCFVDYDDSPRRGKGGKIFINASPEKFKKYFSVLYELCCQNNKEFILLTAWNEWGEGAYLEPDSINEYAYLEALKKVVDK